MKIVQSCPLLLTLPAVAKRNCLGPRFPTDKREHRTSKCDMMDIQPFPPKGDFETMEGTKTIEELRTELAAKAAEDDGFRARLVEDPKAAIKEALDLELPDTVTVHVHEETAMDAHLVLSPTGSLTEAELEAVAAGHVQKGAYRWEHRHGDGPLHT